MLLEPLVDNYKDLKNRKKEIEDIYVDTRTIDLDNLLKRMKLKKEYLLNKRENIDKRIVPAIEKKIVWAEIETLLENNNLEIISVVPLKQTSMKVHNIIKQRLKLKFKGRFINVVKLLYDLDNFRYRTYVESMNINNNVSTSNQIYIQLLLCIIVSDT